MSCSAYYQRYPDIYCIYPFVISLGQDNTGYRIYYVVNNMMYTFKTEHQMQLLSKCGAISFFIESESIKNHRSEAYSFKMRLAKALECFLKERKSSKLYCSNQSFYFSYFIFIQVLIIPDNHYVNLRHMAFVNKYKYSTHRLILCFITNRYTF